jgi:hypothetical protein
MTRTLVVKSACHRNQVRDMEAAMQSPASRRFRTSGLTAVGVYFVVFFITFYVNARVHPTGPVLWLLASLPVLPILCVFVLMGRYLRDERDEYKRDLTIRCLLWGLAGCMAVNLFSDYLRIYGWKSELPPFCAFWAFFVFLMAAKLSYRAKNKVPLEE